MKVAYIVFGVGWLLIIGPAQAGPPFVTDDPELPPPGTWEVNVPFIFELTQGETEMEAPLLDLNYGLSDLQLTADFPLAVVDANGAGAVAGAGELLLGAKWRFLNNEQSQFQLGISPQLLLPTGDQTAVWAKVGLRLCCRCWRRKVGRNGRFSATSVFGGKPLSKRAITFMRA